MSTAQQRLDSFRRLLEHVRERLGLDVGFILWDGSTVPAGLAADAFAISITDEGAIAGLLRSPKLETLAHLWVAKRIDLRNGTLFDLAHLRKTTRTREFRKTLDKSLALRTLLPFLFVSRGGPWPLDRQQQDQRNTGDPSENRKNIS